MSDIKRRIAIVLERHRSYDAGCVTWSCDCGDDFHDTDYHVNHVAEVLMSELGLTREVSADLATHLARGGATAMHIDDLPRKHRYVTEWVAE
jgi:hypothetical protein